MVVKMGLVMEGFTRPDCFHCVMVISPNEEAGLIWPGVSWHLTDR
jgi:hypothetical protein